MVLALTDDVIASMKPARILKEAATVSVQTIDDEW